MRKQVNPPTIHQFSLFGQDAMRPKLKVPMEAAAVKRVKACIDAGDGDGAANELREIRQKLENFETRLNNRRHPSRDQLQKMQDELARTEVDLDALKWQVDQMQQHASAHQIRAWKKRRANLNKRAQLLRTKIKTHGTA